MDANNIVKLSIIGKGQMVHLPEEYQFSSSEKAWERFISCEPATDDFAEAIYEDRKNQKLTVREKL